MIRNSARESTGCYFTSKQFAYSKTGPVEAIALGFKPEKLLEVLRSVAGNPSISLPEHSFDINFSRGKTRFILERFFYSLNAVGTLGAYNEVTQDMICGTVRTSFSKTRVQFSTKHTNQMLLIKFAHICTKILESLNFDRFRGNCRISVKFANRI